MGRTKWLSSAGHGEEDLESRVETNGMPGSNLSEKARQSCASALSPVRAVN